MRFDNKVVAITGAAGNLGRAVAAAFAKAGANRVLVSLTQAELLSAFGSSTKNQILLAADLTQWVDATSVVDKALDNFGQIDVLCNLAGGFAMGPSVHETPDKDWDHLFGLNLRTMLHMAQAIVPVMLKQGRGKIINVGALSASKGMPSMGAYTASKSVVACVTEAMSAELREAGINVNCVMPSVIDTPENRRAMPDANPTRWVAPADLAAAILFLASDNSRAIHGAALPVSGLS